MRASSLALVNITAANFPARSLIFLFFQGRQSSPLVPAGEPQLPYANYNPVAGIESRNSTAIATPSRVAARNSQLANAANSA